MTTIGSLFTGYGGLDMAVRMALDPAARVAWTSDVEPGPCRLAEVRWPGVPNLGDITQVDWSGVEPVDIICGGSPCQDLSLAGRRAGMASGTRSGLWESMFEAVKTMRPRLVVWENVRGSLTSGAFSLVESEQGLLGVGANGPALRAAGRVVGDLAGIGYDSQWCVARASDVGAPHQRERLFLVSHPAGEPWQLRGIAAAGEAQGGRARLSTKFVEWLMGLTEGHVTGADLGLTREQQLRLLGNGVVPQQGATAIYQLTKIALKEAA